MDAQAVLKRILADAALAASVDDTLSIPMHYHGSGAVRLIVLGQDPTVKNAASRQTIKMVLNLDKKGSLQNYIRHICTALDLSFERDLYATNYFKNFFSAPPASLNVLPQFVPYWLPHLTEELAQFPNVPIIALGEPLLEVLAQGNASRKVRDYWGFVPNWQMAEQKPFKSLASNENSLNRLIFPFPHQPSLRKTFYKSRLDAYLAFMKASLDTSGG